jgi:hypothetical protein
MSVYDLISIIGAVITAGIIIFLAINSIPKQTGDHK